MLFLGATDAVEILTGTETKKYGGSRVANNGTWKSFKSGKELKNESYGTYDQPGSVYPKINIQTRLLEILTRERKNNSLWQGISY